MKAINYLVRENESQTNEINSFIGGKPKLPPNMEIPKCKVCGEELTFLFQIAFPKEHSWHGKSMAVFICIFNDQKTHQLIPQMVEADGYNDELNMEIFNVTEEHLNSYEDFFRVIIFDSNMGEILTNYEEKAMYKAIQPEHTEQCSSDEDFVVAGEPIWIMGVNETPQSICDDCDVQLLLQVREDYVFEKLGNAPKQKTAMQKPIGYDLFVANRIYFWGNSDINNPRVYISVQRP